MIENVICFRVIMCYRLRHNAAQCVFFKLSTNGDPDIVPNCEKFYSYDSELYQCENKETFYLKL
jgi:hypothetical protein